MNRSSASVSRRVKKAGVGFSMRVPDVFDGTGARIFMLPPIRSSTDFFGFVNGLNPIREYCLSDKNRL